MGQRSNPDSEEVEIIQVFAWDNGRCNVCLQRFSHQASSIFAVLWKNKTRASKVDAISKAQKAQNIFLEKKT